MRGTRDGTGWERGSLRGPGKLSHRVNHPRGPVFEGLSSAGYCMLLISSWDYIYDLEILFPGLRVAMSSERVFP